MQKMTMLVKSSFLFDAMVSSGVGADSRKMRQLGADLVLLSVLLPGEKTEKIVWITMRAEGRRRSPAKFCRGFVRFYICVRGKVLRRLTIATTPLGVSSALRSEMNSTVNRSTGSAPPVKTS